VGSFGERLRREREMRGVSLDDIAEATKIGTRSLRALEDEHFELLPGGIFNKGFVRAYAKYLGLNADQAVADYLAAAGESTPDPYLIAEQNSSRIDRTVDTGGHRMAGFPIVPVVILLLVIAAGAGGWQLYQQRVRARQAREDAEQAASLNVSRPAETASPSNQPPTNVPGTQAVSPTVGPATGSGVQATPGTSAADLNLPVKSQPSSGGAPVVPDSADLKSGPAEIGAQKTAAAATPVTGNQPFEVSVRAVDRAWVSIKSDGKIAVRGIISPPDVKSVRATEQVVFWTGNAGAVEISFNGQRIALAGGPNSEGSLVFNSRGVVIPRPNSPNREP